MTVEIYFLIIITGKRLYYPPINLCDQVYGLICDLFESPSRHNYYQLFHIITLQYDINHFGQV